MDGQVLKESLCGNCGGIRTHDVLAEFKKREPWDNEGQVWMHYSHSILECRGCRHRSFRLESTFSEDIACDGGWDTKVQHFPPTFPRKCREDISLPIEQEQMYEEVLIAYNTASYMLGAIGLRALVEGICSSLGVEDGPSSSGNGRKSGGIDGKINGLLEKGIAGESEVKALHGSRFMGNEAVHKLIRPTRLEVGLVLDIVEHLMVLAYSISHKAQQIEAARARRNRPKVNTLTDDDDE